VAYVALIKQYAKSIGLHDLDQLDPNNFKAQKAFKLKIVIDVRAKQIVSITAPTTGNQQTYSGYGIPVHVDIPKKTITSAQLQELLSSLQ
jgi:hypothetical protein